MRWCAIVIFMVAAAVSAVAGEEKFRGILEKTDKPEASAQITDALNEIYYVSKSDATEKMIADYIGKNQRVVVTGTIETKPNTQLQYISAKLVEAYAPKLPPAPPPPPPPPAVTTPPAVEHKEEAKKPDAIAPPEVKKVEEKKGEEKK